MGDIIAGRYRLGALIGIGGMGQVFEAEQLSLGRTVAIKLLHPRALAEPDAVKRFEREAKVAAALQHRGAIEVLDFGEDEQGHVYLAMERLHGRPLRAEMPEGKGVALDDAIAALIEIADVLRAAHTQGLVHRDLKPENVFVEEDGSGQRRLVVVDFGLAFIEGRGDLGRMTAEGFIVGTPDYISPEQSLGAEVGPPTDVYALGCIAFELAAGRVPFVGHSMHVLTQHMYAPSPSLAEHVTDGKVPNALTTLVARMLAKDAAARPTIVEVLEELRAISSRHFERARQSQSLEGRSARMLSTIRPSATTSPTTEATGLDLAVIGTLAGDLSLGLAANGIVPYIVTPDESLRGAAAIWAPGASAAEVATLSRYGLPVLTDVGADAERIAELVRAGASEVLARPVRADELARRVLRAVRLAKRKKIPPRPSS